MSFQFEFFFLCSCVCVCECVYFVNHEKNGIFLAAKREKKTSANTNELSESTIDVELKGWRGDKVEPSMEKCNFFSFFFFSPNQNTRKIIKSFLNKWKQKYPPPFWFIPFIRLVGRSVGRSIGSAQWASERMMQWGKNKIACQFQM